MLSAPLYLWPVNGYAYLFFFASVGVHEIFDHAGVKFKIPLLSEAKSHDDHHLRFNCYYGQLLDVLDNFHGTVFVPKEKRPEQKP